jgi:transposase
VHAERARTGVETDTLLDLNERAELERLRRENQDLRMDNEFLGKAAAFFASKQNPRSGSR